MTDLEKRLKLANEAKDLIIEFRNEEAEELIILQLINIK